MPYKDLAARKAYHDAHKEEHRVRDRARREALKNDPVAYEAYKTSERIKRKERYHSDPLVRQRKREARQSPEAKEVRNAAARLRHAERKNNPEYKRRRKNTELKCYFGITIEDYDRILKEQNGLCAICGTLPLKICVDHCHATGKIRGLLCNDCNLGLGKFKDSTEALTNAVQYLKLGVI